MRNEDECQTVLSAMLDSCCEPNRESDPAGIAKHEVSEDGVHWRPYDPALDRNRVLHSRIEFADTED